MKELKEKFNLGNFFHSVLKSIFEKYAVTELLVQ